MKIALVICVALFIGGMGQLFWLRPDVLVNWMKRLPKPLTSIYLSYFRIRGIEPDSPEGLLWFRISGLIGVLASGFILLYYLGPLVKI